MSETQKTLPSQKTLVNEAKSSAQKGDAKGMLKAFAESRVLDGIRRRLDFNWSESIHEMDRDQIIGDTVDAFYDAIQKGTSINDVSAWLSKAASNMAVEFFNVRERHSGLEGDAIQARDEHEPREISQRERNARRRRCLEIARGLLPQISVSENVRKVMDFIFDAVEQGVQDLQPIEVARALGLKETSIREWISRGFERLTSRAKEAGYTREEYELIRIEIEDAEGDRNDE